MVDNISTFDEEIWSGRPWILPSAIVRTIMLVLAIAIFLWFELVIGLADILAGGVTFFWWTLLVLVLIWLFSQFSLVITRFSNLYILRKDGLQIKTGILSLRSFVIVPSGFSDLDVVQSLFDRIIGTGTITINSQSEVDSSKKMIKVRHPSKVADQIRYVMARSIVRIENEHSKQNLL
jgi:uncharacterized membrane protein YdbT with pleckstrin-like domain